MRDKPEFNLEKLKAQAQKNRLPKSTLNDKKFKFWELPSNNGNNNNGKKKKHPRYYKRQLFKIKKELI